MKRKVITIDEEICIGCGLCSSICHEGVIEVIDGKAKVIRENHCDGLGNCLPNCPVDALRLIEKEVISCNSLNRSRWPIQLKLVSDMEGIFSDDELIIAADCSAFTYEGFHKEFSKGKQLVIACPKLDSIDYSDKIRTILKNNKNIKTLKLIRMEVPCCGGLEMMIKKALLGSDINISIEKTIVGVNGDLI